MRQEVYNFFLKRGVPKCMLDDLLLYFDKLRNDNVKIIEIDDKNYVWEIKNKMVLCSLDNLNDKTTNNIEIIRKMLKSNTKRLHELRNIRTFLDGNDQPSREVIDSFFTQVTIFNPKEVARANNNGIIVFCKIFAKELKNECKYFYFRCIGKNIFELNFMFETFRHLFFRMYKQISENCSDDGINKKLQAMSRATDLYNYCDELNEEVNRKLNDGYLKTMLNVLMNLVMSICHVCDGENKDGIRHFKSNVLCLIDYKPQTRKRTSSNSNEYKESSNHKRPKAKVRKLTWRDKRPSRLRTDLPVSMPEVANQKRLERLDAKK